LDNLKALAPYRVDYGLTQAQVFSIPDFWEFLVHEKVVQAIKKILERGYTLTHNFTAPKNKFGVGPVSIAKIPMPNRWRYSFTNEDPFEGITIKYFLSCALIARTNHFIPC
jgi:hypothetical protein